MKVYCHIIAVRIVLTHCASMHTVYASHVLFCRAAKSIGNLYNDIVCRLSFARPALRQLVALVHVKLPSKSQITLGFPMQLSTHLTHAFHVHPEDNQKKCRGLPSPASYCPNSSASRTTFTCSASSQLTRTSKKQSCYRRVLLFLSCQYPRFNRRADTIPFHEDCYQRARTSSVRARTSSVLVIQWLS